MLHGDRDVRSSPTNSEMLQASAYSRDKTLKLYPGAKHQLLQDVPNITEQVIQDMLQWLESRYKNVTV